MNGAWSFDEGIENAFLGKSKNTTTQCSVLCDRGGVSDYVLLLGRVSKSGS